MMFTMLFQFLGDHAPSLGSALVLLFAFGVWGFVMYKKGYHESGVAWKHDVRYMPVVIGQEIREKLERENERKDVAIKMLSDRLRELSPVFSETSNLLGKIARDTLK